MRELSLFTGAGGGILGSKLLGWKTVGYVEWEDYPQRVLAQRIEDGLIDDARGIGRQYAVHSALRPYGAGPPCAGVIQAYRHKIGCRLQPLL